MNLIFAIIIIIGGMSIINEPKFTWHGSIVDFSSPFLHYPIGIFFILSGLYLLIYSLRRNE